MAKFSFFVDQIPMFADWVLIVGALSSANYKRWQTPRRCFGCKLLICNIREASHIFYKHTYMNMSTASQ